MCCAYIHLLSRVSRELVESGYSELNGEKHAAYESEETLAEAGNHVLPPQWPPFVCEERFAFDSIIETVRKKADGPSFALRD